MAENKKKTQTKTGQKKTGSASKSAEPKIPSAQGSTRKNTAPKAPPKSQAKAPAPEREREAAGINKQSLAIIFAAAGVFLFCVAVIPGESLWNAMHNFMLRTFGVCTYIMPVLLLYAAFVYAKDKPTGKASVNLFFSIILLIITGGAVHIFRNTAEYLIDTSLSMQIYEAWENGPVIKGGGVAGALIGGGIAKLFGKTGAVVTVVILIIVSLMLMTGVSLPIIYSALKKPVVKVKDVTSERMEENARRREEARQRQEEESEGEEPQEEKDKKRKKPVDIDVEPPVAQEPPAPAKPKIPEIGTSVPVGTLSEPPMPEIKAGEAATAVAPAVLKGIGDTGAAAAAAGAGAAVIKDATLKKKKASKKNEAEPSAREKEIDAIEKERKETKAGTGKRGEYELPPITCLDLPRAGASGDFQTEMQTGAEKLIETLESFKVKASISAISRGPSVTRYELVPEAGIRINRITNLSDDIALRLAAKSVRIEAPIPGKSAIGIEVPNSTKAMVTMREVIDTDVYRAGAAKSKLNVALGKNITGDIITADLAKMPHLLVAGTTGSGKSVCLNTMIISILYNAKPDEVKLLMIDPKMVEFTIYNGISHLEVPVVSNPRKAAGALAWAVSEMEKRYRVFSENKVRDFKGYNRLAEMNPELTKMHHIVIFIDELSDLMMASPKEVEDSICRLAQMARAAGIHMVIATQRPSVDVITGIIRANIPSRIALYVSSQIDSRIIIDQSGAEKLLGNGDMLFAPVGESKPSRVQGCFISDEEVERVVSYIKQNSVADYNDDIMREIEAKAAATGSGKTTEADGEEDALDPMFDQAAEAVILAGQASTTMLQKKLKLGYARASRVMDQLEERGIVGPSEGAKPRQVLLSKQEWYEQQALAEGNKNVQLEFNTEPPAESDYYEEEEIAGEEIVEEEDGFADIYEDEESGEEAAEEDAFADIYEDEDSGEEAAEEDGFADIFEDESEDDTESGPFDIDDEEEYEDDGGIVPFESSAPAAPEGGDGGEDASDDDGDGYGGEYYEADDIEVVDLEEDVEEFIDEFEDLPPVVIDDVFSDDDFDDDSFFD